MSRNVSLTGRWSCIEIVGWLTTFTAGQIAPVSSIMKNGGLVHRYNRSAILRGAHWPIVDGDSVPVAAAAQVSESTLSLSR